MKFESTSGIQNGKLRELQKSVERKNQSLLRNADFGGVITDPWGLERAGFEFSGEINRKDYGLGWSQVTGSRRISSFR